MSAINSGGLPVNEESIRGVFVPAAEVIRGEIPCMKCGLLLDQLDQESWKTHFDGQTVVCPRCNSHISVWEVARKLVDRVSAHSGLSFLLAGCAMRVGNVAPVPNRIILVDLEEQIGDGELLHLDYLTLGEGEVTALPWPLDHIITHRPRKTAHFFAYSPRGTISDKTVIQISVWYAERRILESTPRRLLLDALRHFRRQEYDRMIVVANTCLEVLSSAYFTGAIGESDAAKPDVKSFLQDGATYSHQIRVLLPLFTHLTGKKLPEKRIMDGLKDLNALRNAVVHKGRKFTHDENDLLENAMTAAYCGFMYFTAYLGVKA